MQFIGKTFIKGLIVVLPPLLTLYLVVWLGTTIERVIKPLVDHIPFVPYVPGLGVVLVVALIFVVGLMVTAPIGRRLMRYFEQLIARIPLISSLYGSLRDLMGLFGSNKNQVASKVVTVDLGDGRGKVLGFVTRETFDDLPAGIGGADQVAVYLPMSYQIGGYTTIISRDSVQPVEMPIEQAMRFAVTAGVKTSDDPVG